MVNIKKIWRKYLCKILGIPEWHITQSNERPYAQLIIKKINEMIEASEISGGRIIEVGCGMGDIISSINYRDKAGYDIDKKVIWGGRIAHLGELFKVGTFDDIKNEEIGILIVVNFLHGLDDEYCRRKLNAFLMDNRVARIVVDTVPSPPYKYFHDYEKLLGGLGYVLEYRSRGFSATGNSRRRILFFKKCTHPIENKSKGD